MELTNILICVAVAVIAAALAVTVTLIVQKSMAKTRAKAIVADAEREADDLKRNKILEGREEALQITAEAEKHERELSTLVPPFHNYLKRFIELTFRYMASC